MNKELLKMKEELKELAIHIRNGKSGRKPRFRNESNKKDWASLEYNKHHFRHLHIAYCTIRGRSREEIEQPRWYNKPNEYLINKIIDRYNAEREEALRTSAERSAA